MDEFKFYCSHCDHPLQCDPCFAGRQIQSRLQPPPPHSQPPARHRLHPCRAAIRPHLGHASAQGAEGLRRQPRTATVPNSSRSRVASPARCGWSCGHSRAPRI